MNAPIQISMKEIYEALCPECQEKIRDIARKKLTDKAIDNALKEVGDGTLDS